MSYGKTALESARSKFTQAAMGTTGALFGAAAVAANPQTHIAVILAVMSTVIAGFSVKRFGDGLADLTCHLKPEEVKEPSKAPFHPSAQVPKPAEM